MATNYPDGLDTFTNPTGSQLLSNPAVLHSAQHTNLNDAVLAIQIKVGINGSEDEDSIEYRLSEVEALLEGGVGIGGSGTAGRVAYWSDTDEIAGDAGLTYDATNDTLTVSGSVTTTPRVVVRAADGQTGNIAEWQHFNTTVLVRITPDGFLYTPEFRLWRNGGTGTAAELYSEASAGTWISNPNGIRLQTGAALGLGLELSSANAGATTRVEFNYGTYEGYFDVNSDQTLTFSGSAGIAVGVKVTAASAVGFFIQGVASQTAPLIQLRGVSSTQAREMAEVDAVWLDSTDATRKVRHVRRVYDTAARETMREWADGSAGRVALSAPASAPTDSHLANGQISFSLDETGDNLLIRVKYSDGTLATATVGLVLD